MCSSDLPRQILRGHVRQTPVVIVGVTGKKNPELAKIAGVLYLPRQRPGVRQRISDLSDRISEAIWRIIPVSKARMAQALALVAVVVVVGAYFTFLGSDDDADTCVITEPTATTEPAVPTAPVSTPIAALVVPDDLVPFGELNVVPVRDSLHADSMVLPRNVQGQPSGTLPFGTPIEKENENRETQLRNLIGGNRMLLLVYAPGVDPFASGEPLNVVQDEVNYLSNSDSNLSAEDVVIS